MHRDFQPSHEAIISISPSHESRLFPLRTVFFPFAMGPIFIRHNIRPAPFCLLCIPKYILGDDGRMVVLCQVLILTGYRICQSDGADVFLFGKNVLNGPLTPFRFAGWGRNAFLFKFLDDSEDAFPINVSTKNIADNLCLLFIDNQLALGGFVVSIQSSSV